MKHEFYVQTKNTNTTPPPPPKKGGGEGEEMELCTVFSKTTESKCQKNIHFLQIMLTGKWVKEALSLEISRFQPE